MGALYTIICENCRHVAQLSFQPDPARRLRCTKCQGLGAIVEDDATRAMTGRDCLECGEPIAAGRLMSDENAVLCVDCAADAPFAQASRKITESWGSREAWRRDRASWKRTH